MTLNIPVDPADPFAVVALGADDTGHGMPVLFGFVDGRIRDKIPTHHIVNIAVVVVVYAVTGRLPAVDPDIFLDIFVLGIEATVQYGHNDRIALCADPAGGNAPGFVGLNSIQAPLLQDVGIIGIIARIEVVIILHTFHVRKALQLAHQFLRTDRGRIVEQQADIFFDTELFTDPDPSTCPAVGRKICDEVLRRHSPLEFYQQAAFVIGLSPLGGKFQAKKDQGQE